MISSIIIFVFLLIAILGAIPYAILMIVTAMKKNWRLLRRLFLVPIAVSLIIIVGCYALSYVEEVLQNRDVFDTYVFFDDPVFEFHSERHFNGDGYSIWVYPLPVSIRARFEKVDGELLTNYPKRPSYQANWSAEHWKKSPVDPKFNKYVDFVLMERGEDNNLDKVFSDVQASLTRDTTYYSFFAKAYDDFPSNIDFFIVDLKEGRVYIINFDT